MLTESEAIARLCTACGMCCNGALFADVELQVDDDAAALEKLGLRVKRLKTKTKLTQPCAAFDGCHCRIYSNRPSRCKRFECLQLIKVRNGETIPESALRSINDARRQIKRIEKLLETLGRNDTTLPLSRRFRRCLIAAENGDWSADNLETLAELQLTVHQFNVQLQRDFYP